MTKRKISNGDAQCVLARALEVNAFGSEMDKRCFCAWVIGYLNGSPIPDEASVELFVKRCEKKHCYGRFTRPTPAAPVEEAKQ